MRHVIVVLLLSFVFVHSLLGQGFTFIINGSDLEGNKQSLAFGVNTQATFCVDFALGERNNYSTPPFPYNLTWANPRSGGPCDNDDCFSCGRLSYMGNPPLDLRGFTSPAQADTYKISMYSFVDRMRSWPFHFDWKPNFSQYCDSMHLQYTSNSKLNVIDMFQDSTALISDANVQEVYIIKWGAKFPPYLSLNPDSLSFGFITPGNYDILPVAASNLGSSLLYIDSMKSTNPLFTIDHGLEDSSIETGQSKTFYVIFSPDTIGYFTGSIVVYHKGINSPDTLHVSGVGRTPSAHLLSFDPPIVNFGHVPIDSSVSYIVTATNTAPVPVMVNSTSTTAGGFSFSTGLSDSGPIPPGESREFQVNFAPLHYGYVSGYVFTAYNQAPIIDSLPLEGYGGLPNATFALSLDTLDFGIINNGTSKLKSVTVTNTGAPDLHITSVISDNPRFYVNPSSVTLTAGSQAIFNIIFNALSYVPSNGHIIFTHDGATSPDTLVVLGRGRVTTSVKSRWNLISSPVIALNDSVKTLFPTSLFNYCFSYSESSHYQLGYRVQNKVGYWAKFPSNQTVAFTGSPVSSDTINLSTGWNLIGSLSDPVITSSVQPIGTTLTTAFFEYSAGYKIADTIKPGKGYWIKSSGNGTLLLSSSLLFDKSEPMPATVMDVHAYNTLKIVDANGNDQTLYFTQNPVSPEQLQYYTLPPSPPDGEFNVRYGSGRLLEQLSQSNASVIPIILRGAQFPIQIAWEMNENARNVFLKIGGETLPLQSGNVYTVSSVSTIALMTKSGVNQPAVFALKQNYPNPFNPTTTIAYSIPSDGYVTLKIYSMVGQEIATLVNTTQLAGEYQMQFDASSLSSGLYYYRLMFNGKVQTKQMMFIK